MRAPAEVGGVAAPFARAAEVVRTQDRDRYIADLFAPEPARRHLFALHAFSVEVARVRDVVRDPALGEIRLQWWRDAIEQGDGGGNPIATALTATMARFALPKGAFDRLIDARLFDLYDDPMPTLNDLEGYAGDTSSALFHLAAMVLAGGRDPGTAIGAGHAGVAYALTGLLRALPRHAARRQCYFPESMIVSRSVDKEAMFAGTGGNRPKLTFIGWNERWPARLEMCPPVMWPRSAPKAVVGGGAAIGSRAARPRRSGRRAARSRPIPHSPRSR
jgi:phytoene/squalene synthetase